MKSIPEWRAADISPPFPPWSRSPWPVATSHADAMQIFLFCMATLSGVQVITVFIWFLARQ
jgi:hypothetical protein